MYTFKHVCEVHPHVNLVDLNNANKTFTPPISPDTVSHAKGLNGLKKIEREIRKRMIYMTITGDRKQFSEFS